MTEYEIINLKRWLKRKHFKKTDTENIPNYAKWSKKNIIIIFNPNSLTIHVFDKKGDIRIIPNSFDLSKLDGIIHKAGSLFR